MRAGHPFVFVSFAYNIPQIYEEIPINEIRRLFPVRTEHLILRPGLLFLHPVLELPEIFLLLSP